MNFKRYRALAVATCVGMLIVLLAGSLVTNTGAGEGCGTDWPLCNGKFVPAYTLESLIEYSHRAVTGLEGLLVLATFIATIKYHRRHREAVWYAGGAGVFTVVQALMGAAAVIWSQSSAVMALHFGFSILAFTFTLLLVMWAGRMAKGETAADARVPRSVYRLSLTALVYSYVVIYLGAFVRHTDSAGGCIGWPLCSGRLIPVWEGAAPIVFTHRVAAALLFFLILWLFLHIGRVKGGSLLKRTAAAVLVLVGTQVLSGALLTYTLTNRDWFIFTSMLHNLIVSILFAVLADLTIRSWKWAEGRESRQ